VHEPIGLRDERTPAVDLRVAGPLREGLIHLREETLARLETFFVDVRRVGDVLRHRPGLLHDERPMLNSEEAAADARTTEAHEGREAGRGLSHALRHPTAERRVLHGRRRDVTGAQEILRALVVAFLARHAAHDRELVRLRCELRQVLADHDPGHVRLDRLVRTGDLARLRIPRVDVARPTIHPEKDDVLGILLRFAGLVGKSGTREPRAHHEPEATGEKLTSSLNHLRPDLSG
jgi:hypothetical protein